MRHQQEAEKEEKKRLKDLVLNLDLRDDTEPDGIDPFSYLLKPNPNVRLARQMSRQPVSRRGSADFAPPASCSASLSTFVKSSSPLPVSNNENAITHTNDSRWHRRKKPAEPVPSASHRAGSQRPC
jgi:hypothetical protein